MKNFLLGIFTFSILCVGCIGDDVIMDEVDETLEITNLLLTLGQGDSYQLMTKYINNIGVEEEADIIWSSSDEAIITVSNEGFVTGNAKGTATVTATIELANQTLSESNFIEVGDETIQLPLVDETRSGTIATTSSYVLEGEFEISKTDTGIRIDIAESYEASTALPGLYIYLGNNPNSIGNALEIQAVQVFSGAHFYEIDGVDLNDYSYILYWCKPFGVKVGDGEIQ